MKNIFKKIKDLYTAIDLRLYCLITRRRYIEINSILYDVL